MLTKIKNHLVVLIANINKHQQRYAGWWSIDLGLRGIRIRHAPGVSWGTFSVLTHRKKGNPRWSYKNEELLCYKNKRTRYGWSTRFWLTNWAMIILGIQVLHLVRKLMKHQHRLKRGIGIIHSTRLLQCTCSVITNSQSSGGQRAHSSHKHQRIISSRPRCVLGWTS